MASSKELFRIHIRAIIGGRGNNVQGDDGGVHYLLQRQNCRRNI